MIRDVTLEWKVERSQGLRGGVWCAMDLQATSDPSDTLTHELLIVRMALVHAARHLCIIWCDSEPPSTHLHELTLAHIRDDETGALDAYADVFIGVAW